MTIMGNRLKLESVSYVAKVPFLREDFNSEIPDCIGFNFINRHQLTSIIEKELALNSYDRFEVSSLLEVLLPYVQTKAEYNANTPFIYYWKSPIQEYYAAVCDRGCFKAFRFSKTQVNIPTEAN